MSTCDSWQETQATKYFHEKFVVTDLYDKFRMVFYRT